MPGFALESKVPVRFRDNLGANEEAQQFLEELGVAGSFLSWGAEHDTRSMCKAGRAKDNLCRTADGLAFLRVKQERSWLLLPRFSFVNVGRIRADRGRSSAVSSASEHECHYIEFFRQYRVSANTVQTLP